MFPGHDRPKFEATGDNETLGDRCPPPPPPPTRRLAASRRRARGVKTRRLIPALVVGTTTIASMGALVVWVSNQPGIKPATTLTVSSASVVAKPGPAAEASAATREAAMLAAVQQQLLAENKALQSLQFAVTKADAARRAASLVAAPGAARTSAAGTGSSNVAAVPSATFSPLPTIPVVAVPAPIAAPIVSATTGASHAIP